MPPKHYDWTAPWNHSIPSRRSGSQDNNLLVYQYIQNYARRQLTYERDIVNALFGVFGAFASLNVYHHWGVSFQFMEYNSLTSFVFRLTWTFEPLYRSVWQTTSQQGSLLSWSWAGWFYPTAINFGTPEFNDKNFRLPPRTSVAIEAAEGSIEREMTYRNFWTTLFILPFVRGQFQFESIFWKNIK